MSEEEIKLNELKAAILDAEVAWTKAKESFEKAISMQKELLSSTKKIDEVVNEMEAAPEETIEAPVEEVVEAPAENVEAPVEKVTEASAENVEAPVEEVTETPAENVEAPVEEVTEAPAENVEAPVEEVTEATPVVPVVNIPMEPVEEQVKDPIAPTVPVSEEPKEEVVEDSNIVLPVLNGTENEVTAEQAVPVAPVATTETNKVTFKKEYENVDKAILVNEGQMGKLKSSKEAQKALMNYTNTNVSGEVKPAPIETNDLEAMMAQVEEAKAKGDMAEAERLLNQVSEINNSNQFVKTA